MKKHTQFTSPLLFVASFLASANAFAHGDEHKKETPPAAPAPADKAKADSTADKAAVEWMVKAKAAYPLDTCVVSGDKLDEKDGDMGPPVEYIFKQDGKPDRLVRLCCKSCIKKLTKDPAKYLKKIDDAAAAKAKDAKPAEGDPGKAKTDKPAAPDPHADHNK